VPLPPMASSAKFPPFASSLLALKLWNFCVSYWYNKIIKSISGGRRVSIDNLFNVKEMLAFYTFR
jgi:hypothetical protein